MSDSLGAAFLDLRLPAIAIALFVLYSALTALIVFSLKRLTCSFQTKSKVFYFFSYVAFFAVTLLYYRFVSIESVPHLLIFCFGSALLMGCVLLVVDESAQSWIPTLVLLALFAFVSVFPFETDSNPLTQSVAFSSLYCALASLVNHVLKKKIDNEREEE